MKERLATVIRWVLIGVAVVLLVRSASGGCSTLPEVGSPAPGFAVPDAWGSGTWSLEAFQGAPVVLVFFATWCPSCREELPEVTKALASLPAMKVLLLSDEAPQHVGTWLKGHGYAIAAGGAAGPVWRAYGVRVVPSVVVVGADGNIAYAGQGGSALTDALNVARKGMAEGAAHADVGVKGRSVEPERERQASGRN